MDYQDAIQKSRAKKLVPDDKFDNHIKKAKENDLLSRKAIFCQQTNDDEKGFHKKTEL